MHADSFFFHNTGTADPDVTIVQSPLEGKTSFDRTCEVTVDGLPASGFSLVWKQDGQTVSNSAHLVVSYLAPRKNFYSFECTATKPDGSMAMRMVTKLVPPAGVGTAGEGGGNQGACE